MLPLDFTSTRVPRSSGKRSRNKELLEEYETTLTYKSKPRVTNKDSETSEQYRSALDDLEATAIS